MLTPAVLSAAVALAAVLQPATAIDYPGGWLPSPPNEQCVDICANSSPKPYCFDKTSTTCPLKLQRPGDFDWMAFEQLFVPQFCRDLLKGVDTTLSHQNVNPAPNGLACQPDVVKTELTIHGLWPNYNGGYAGCCNVTDTIPNKPFDAADFARHHKSLLNKMKKQWIEPTQSTTYEALCHIYNHEFQKHGLCYNAFGDDYEQAAVNYFQSALAVAKELKHATKQINEWAEDRETTTVAAIQSLYDKNVMVLCSTPDPSNKFSGIRSCWDKPETLDSDGPFVQIDCPELKAGAQFTPCDAANPITLTEYELGGAEATAF